MITFRNASPSASSVPGLICSQISDFFAQHGFARIDRDQARLAQQRFADVEACLAVGARVRRIVAPVHDELRRRAAGEVADGQVAHRLDAGVHARVEALREPGLAPVRRAERVAEARDPADVMAARAGAHRDRLGTALGADLQDLLADLVERLVPRDALPLAGAARTDAPLRVFQAIGVIDELRGRGADRAEVAVIQRTFGIALDLRELAVLRRASACCSHRGSCGRRSSGPSRFPLPPSLLRSRSLPRPLRKVAVHRFHGAYQNVTGLAINRGRAL